MPRGIDSGSLPEQFRAPFVHGERARQHPAARIRKAHEFQGALHRSIFAITSMQGDMNPIESLIQQCFHMLLRRIERMRVDVLPPERLQHRLAAFERDFTLSRASAKQNGNFSEIPSDHAFPLHLLSTSACRSLSDSQRSPMIFTSCCRSIPVFSLTAFRTAMITASISAAV